MIAFKSLMIIKFRINLRETNNAI